MCYTSWTWCLGVQIKLCGLTSHQGRRGLSKRVTAFRLSYFLLLSSWEALWSALAAFSCFLAADSWFCFSSICNHNKHMQNEVHNLHHIERKCLYLSRWQKKKKDHNFLQGNQDDAKTSLLVEGQQNWRKVERGGLPWSEGFAWTSQMFWVELSGGYRGWPPPGWLGCMTGFLLGCCHQLETRQWCNKMGEVA